MRGRRFWVAVAILAALAGITKLATADDNPCSPPKKAVVAEPALSAKALSARIDAHINERLKAEHVRPAPLADDAEFMRRVYLDLGGKIPLLSEVHDFLDPTNHTPNKRDVLITDLLERPSYVNHFTNVWRALLLPQSNNQQIPVAQAEFEAWLHERLQLNTGYDQMVREILTVPVSGGMQMRRRSMAEPTPPKPVAFFQANELKPENLAASTSRVFLGVKLECAQCHNHPHAEWTRNQFWEFAAFFSGAGGSAGYGERPSLKIPGSEKIAPARFLDGKEPRWSPETQPRAVLADWITTGNNRYFARAAVNRLWAHLFGVGLVDPVDDLNDQNPPSHPELLDELAYQFAANKYDIKYLIRAIVGSQAYQRTSAQTDPSQKDPRLFARMSVRGLSPEQLFDSLVQATGMTADSGTPNPRQDAAINSIRAQFLARFGNQEKRTEYHTSILQALALMNGKLVENETSFQNLQRAEEAETRRDPVAAEDFFRRIQSHTLAGIAFFTYKRGNIDRVQKLFFATLSRTPTAEESERMVRYVDSGGPRHDQKAALADVFWALLNSSEFFLNH